MASLYTGFLRLQGTDRVRSAMPAILGAAQVTRASHNSSRRPRSVNVYGQFSPPWCAAEAHGEGVHYELINRVNKLSCARDEGRSLGIGFQEQVSNRPKLLR